MKKLKFCLFFCVLTFFIPVKQANADLTITPTRVVFNDGDRFATVTLVNTSKETKSYEMRWVFFRMQEEGTPYQPIEKSVTDFDVSQYLAFTPKRVTLAPGSKQKIRLALRRPADMPKGDFRGHLEFSAVPDAAKEPAPSSNPADSKAKSGAVVKINLGYSIPVVVRSGTPDAKAVIDQISFKTGDSGRLNALIPVRREGGPYSVLGYLYVYHIGTDGKEVLVGEVSNAHIFPEVNRRVFDVPMTKSISGGSLKVVMRYYDPNNAFVYDEKTFPVQ